MLRGLYDWMMRAAAGKNAERSLGVVSFAESSFFPIPPDVMLIPMVLARPERAWWLATLTTITSVIGGMAGYAIGYFLLDTVGMWIIDTYNLHAGMETFKQYFAEYGVWVVAVFGFTPLPYKLATIASGIAMLPLGPFMLASIATRGARFFLVAALLKYFGPSIRVFIEKHFNWLSMVFVVLLIGGFVAVVRYM
jgi:membrane protein YqaA with SNARE-associated domain